MQQSNPYYTTLSRLWPLIVCVILSVVIVGAHALYTEKPSVHNTASFIQNMSEDTPTQTTELSMGVPWVYTFDERTSPTIDMLFWNVENGVEVSNYNSELQAYTDRTSNVRVEGDSLVIEAKPEQLYGKNYTSARINTQGTMSFTYGTLEVDMKLPRGTGTWPAAWLMPDNNRYSPTELGVDPNSPSAWALNGEIDFLESVGYIPGEVIPAVHNYNSMTQQKTIYTPGMVPDMYDTYHRYGVIKTPDSITFTIDGKPYASRVKQSDNPLDWPYDQSYYLILNLAIGGKWAGAEGVDESSAPWKMHVRSISYQPL